MPHFDALDIHAPVSPVVSGEVMTWNGTSGTAVNQSSGMTVTGTPGETWSINTGAVDTVASIGYHVIYSSDGAGSLFRAIIAVDSSGDISLEQEVSADDGTTWTRRVTSVLDVGDNGPGVNVNDAGCAIRMHGSTAVGGGVQASITYDGTTDTLDVGLDSTRARFGPTSWEPAYCSIVTTADSNASADAFGPFTAGSYTAYTFATDIAARGITYAEAAGTFTCADAGVYLVTFNVIATHSAASTVALMVNGGTARPHVNNGAGGDGRGMSAVVSVAAGGTITASVENTTGINTTVCKAGTSISIVRVA